MIAHIVLFTPRTIDPVESKAFAQSIVSVFRHVASLERAFVGRSIELDAGYQRSFGDKTYEFAAVLEFKDRPALLAYLNHPLHKELGALFWKHCDSTVIVEVEAADATSDAAIALLLESSPKAR